MVLNSIRGAVESPELATTYLDDLYQSSREFWTDGEYLKLIDHLYTECGGRSFYIPLMYWRDRSTLLETEIYGSELVFPLSDSGISYELVMHGQREHKATEIFREQLERINAEVDEVTVIEAGANVGYYLVQEAEILDSDTHIHAFEPVPDNVNMLKKNIRANDIGDIVDLAPIAASSERTTVEMDVNTESNWARVDEEGGIDTVPVEAWPIDDYLDEHGVGADTVNIVRMDVEGYEGNVLEGMETVIGESEPLLLFMELHASFLRENGELEPLLDFLTEHDFELVSAVRRRTELDTQTIDELRDISGAPNIFLYKGE